MRRAFHAFFRLLCVCTVFAAQAKDLPDWVASFPKETADYKFYVGRGQAETEAQAVDKASKNVYEQALKMNFGVQMQMNAETYQTESEARLTERFVEQSALVRFNDFEQIDQYTEKSKGKYNVWVLYRYSKAAIKAEKKRLADLPKQAKKELSVVGSSDDVAKGTVEIETRPVDGADVYIDGERFGQTPLRLIGALKAGTHDLRLDHPLFDAIEETLIVVPGKTVKVAKTLRRAFADVEISSTPENAEVRLNGRRIGTTPLKTKILAGEKNSLSLRHPETEESVHYLTLAKNDNKSYLFDLIDKPSKISFFSFPDKADVFLDGEKIGTTPLRARSVSRGRHFVSVEKDGYEFQTRTLDVKGGEEKNETFSLTASKQPVFGTRAEQTDRHRKYEEIRPSMPALRLKKDATPDDAVEALLRWNFPPGFLRVSVSRTNRMAEDTYRFFIRLSFDENAYKRHFATRFSEVLTPFSSETKEKDMAETCAYNAKAGVIGCKKDSVEGHDTVYLRTGKTEHGFLWDEAPYKTFKVFTGSDWKERRIPNVSSYKVRLEIFNADGQKTYTEDLPFKVRRFTLEKNRNVLFSPAFYIDSQNSAGLRDLLLATELTIEEPIEKAIGKTVVKIMTD